MTELDFNLYMNTALESIQKHGGYNKEKLTQCIYRLCGSNSLSIKIGRSKNYIRFYRKLEYCTHSKGNIDPEAEATILFKDKALFTLQDTIYDTKQNLSKDCIMNMYIAGAPPNVVYEKLRYLNVDSRSTLPQIVS